MAQSDINDDFKLRIEKLVHRLIDPDETARAAAARALYTSVHSAGLHASDLRIGLDGSVGEYPIVERLANQIQVLYNENQFFRRNVLPELLKRGSKAGLVDYRWPKLKELVRSRTTGDDLGNLQPGWKTKLADLLHISAYVIARWEEGTEQIPDRIFDELEMMPEIRPAVHPATQKSAKIKKAYADDIAWEPTTYQESFRLLNTKKGIPAVMKLTGASSGQIKRKFINDPPDEALFGRAIPILDSGPMDFPELWKIGCKLFGDGQSDTWKKSIRQLFEVSGKLEWDDPVWLTEEQRNSLRQAYHGAAMPMNKQGPLEVGEIMSIQKLWPADIAEEAANCFILSHVQDSWQNLDPKHSKILRDRYKRELTYRNQNPRYSRISQALGLVEKRTERQAKADDKSDMDGAELRHYAESWFGTDKPHQYLGQLFGYAASYTKEMFKGTRDVTETVKQLILSMDAIVSTLDLPANPQ